MSESYLPVLWNRQKKRYDLVMGGLMLLYLVTYFGLQLTFHPDITPETLIIRATGTLAFLMLHLILVIGPLCRLNPLFLPLLYNRRHLGVTMFLIALIHGVFNILQFHSLGDTSPILSIFTANEQYASIGNFPFQTLGFFALLILFIMAATSHDFWLKNLSPRVWKNMHMMVYMAYVLIFAHVMLGSAQLDSSLLTTGLVGFGGIVVASMHLLAARKVKQDQLTATAGEEKFYEVCPVEEIADDRAKTILIGDENIAIYKYDGRLSAINNVCKHQGGPLGEGKIVDGCITCPWHGYQYLPHNGQSPPPFTEKVSTYDLKIENGIVYVNPTPYPEGTERPPVEIKND